VGRWLSPGTLDPYLTAVHGSKRQRRQNAAAAATASDERRRARWRDPHLGFLATVWDSDGLYAKRAGQQIDLGRRSWQRRGGAGARRGGAAAQVRRWLQGVAEHGFDVKRRGAASYLLARLLGGFTATKERRRRRFLGGGGLGFRRLAEEARVAARARVAASRGGGRIIKA
jgi:hypothetical protein